jgi:hypothetical protein
MTMILMTMNEDDGLDAKSIDLESYMSLTVLKMRASFGMMMESQVAVE